MNDSLLIERGILLNFSPHGFWAPHLHRLELVWHPTNEHFFQAGKADFVEDADDHLRMRLYDEIVQAVGPGQAKDAGKLLRPFDSFGWDEHAPRRMLEGLLHKFTQNVDARVALRETGDRPLVEHRPDPTWGDDLDGSGRNLMGLALVHVRERLCR